MYNDGFGNNAVPGGGRTPCISPASRVEQLYCRVLQRPVESETKIEEWLDWLDYGYGDNTFKDLVRVVIRSGEFKNNFVTGKSNATLASTLFDVLLARAGDAGGLVTWENHIKVHGWEKAVDMILASKEYDDDVGDDAVPGAGRTPCVSPASRVEQLYCRVLQRPVESETKIEEWLDWLDYGYGDNTFKDLVRVVIRSGEFKNNFVTGKSNATLISQVH
jgi:hypothetical protein